jgi:hypothetical protein
MTRIHRIRRLAGLPVVGKRPVKRDTRERAIA